MEKGRFNFFNWASVRVVFYFLHSFLGRSRTRKKQEMAGEMAGLGFYSSINHSFNRALIIAPLQLSQTKICENPLPPLKPQVYRSTCPTVIHTQIKNASYQSNPNQSPLSFPSLSPSQPPSRKTNPRFLLNSRKPKESRSCAIGIGQFSNKHFLPARISFFLFSTYENGPITSPARKMK